MSLFEISTTEFIQRTYHIEAETAEEARTRFEAMDWNDQRDLLQFETDIGDFDEEITSIYPCDMEAVAEKPKAYDLAQLVKEDSTRTMFFSRSKPV